MPYKSNCLFSVFLLLCLPMGLLTAKLGPEEAFPVLEGMQDQHEAAYPWPEEARHVLVAFTMATGKAANRFIAAQPEAETYLERHQAVFLANIHGMPAIGRLFAMPKMRKYPHRIMLADAEGLLDDFPEKEDRVTVFELDGEGTIKAIRYWDPDSEKSPF